MKFALVKFVAIAGTCAALIVGVRLLTQVPVAENRLAQFNAALQSVTDLDLTKRTPLWENNRWLLSPEQTMVRAEAAGYAGGINLLGTLSNTATTKIIKLKVTAHSETPGIGNFIEGEWMDRFEQIDANQLTDIDAMTGATITSRAIIDAVARLLATQDQTQEIPSTNEPS